MTTTEIIPLQLLMKPEIQAAFSVTARNDLLKPMVEVVNKVNGLLTGTDGLSARERLNSLAQAVALLQTIPQPTGLINVALLNLLAFQTLVNEVELIRQQVNTIVAAMKNLGIITP